MALDMPPIWLGRGGVAMASAVAGRTRCLPHWQRMQVVLLKLGAWFLQKFGAALVIVVVALGAYGLWLFLQEEGAFEGKRVERLQRAIADRDQILAAQA